MTRLEAAIRPPSGELRFVSLKEVRMRMRMLRRCDLLTAEHDPVISESDELVRIVATVIRKSEGG